uniref:Uncharacterized protein n=1 Tax=Ovis aries TaxID=9940 RepID=A0AC11CZQ2_SHEEP
MVNVLKGVLIECDPAMKQFLLYLDESNALGKKFIIQDIDDTHVFVIAELVNVLQERPALLVKKMWKRTMKHYPKIQFLKAPRIRNNQMEKIVTVTPRDTCNQGEEGSTCYREDKEKLPSGIIVSSHQGEKSFLESSHMPIPRPFTGKEEWSILRSPAVFLTEEFQIYGQSR